MAASARGTYFYSSEVGLAIFWDRSNGMSGTYPANGLLKAASDVSVSPFVGPIPKYTDIYPTRSFS